MQVKGQWGRHGISGNGTEAERQEETQGPDVIDRCELRIGPQMTQQLAGCHMCSLLRKKGLFVALYETTGLQMIG